VDSELETVSVERAAELLGVPKAHFLKLLETRVVSSHTAGGRVRLYLRDILTFARKRDEERPWISGYMSATIFPKAVRTSDE